MLTKSRMSNWFSIERIISYLAAAFSVCLWVHCSFAEEVPVYKPNPHVEIFRPGTGVRHLPPDHITVDMPFGRFLYHGGNFFVARPDGFEVVEPPIGAIVPYLPPEPPRVVIGGVTYYTIGIGWYADRPDGAYEVIRPVTDKDVPFFETAEQFTTVYAGPSNNTQAVKTVSRGTRVRVLERQGNWFHVQLMDTGIGWIFVR
jgi:hypothetical protein